MKRRITVLFCLWLISILVISPIPTLLPCAKAQTSPLRTVWENPFTLTTHRSNDEINSTLYTFPKVIWNGSQYVDYILNSSDMSAGIGSVYIKVCPDHTVFYDPYRTEEIIKRETWIVDYYNGSSSAWENDDPLDNVVNSLVNSSGMYFDRTATLSSGATLDEWYWLRVGSELKISVVLHPAQSGNYKLVWVLDHVSCTKVCWLTTTENVTSQLVIDKSCVQVRFASENESKCLVDWSDTSFFNETSREWETCFQELGLQKITDNNTCQATISFGNFTLTGSEPVVLDPTISTFNSTKSADGGIEKYGSSYPPTDGTSVDTSGYGLTVGQYFEYGNYNFYQDRSYLSFDTSTISAMAYNISATLRLKTCLDFSDDDFTVLVMGGNLPVCVGNLTIMNGPQPIYNHNLTANSWDAGQVQVASWNTVEYSGGGIYINLTIPSSQIDKADCTEFELKSSQEGAPPREGYPAYVVFYSGDSTGNEPELEVSYYLDTVTIPWSYQPFPWAPNNETWLYRNVSTSKAVIVLFGGLGLVYDYSIDHPDERLFGKIQFLDALIGNGFSVFTPLNDGINVNPPMTFSSYRYETWIQDLVMYLMYNKTYTRVYLFGFSEGGLLVGNEIEKDYASTLSAAVMNCAPDFWGCSYEAQNAKVATSFSEDENDYYYADMENYYGNEIVDKEWHNFTGVHGFFDPNCTCNGSNDPAYGENDSVVVINWFDAAHPPSTPFTPTGSQTCYANAAYSYSSGTINPNGGNLAYNFSWGDGTYNLTDWYSSGVNVTASHTWNAQGTYNVTVQAENTTGSWSTWSQPLTVNVPRPYDVTMKSHCITEGADVNVQVTMDNSPQDHATPYTFANLIATHNFTVDNTDADGHAFKRWNTEETSTTISASSGETYIAYYGSGHDVSVMDVEPSKTVVGQNYTINVTVTAGNPGDYNENLNVTLYANTTAIASNVTSVSSGAPFFNITFVWNTTSFAYGNYTIKAQAWQVPGETDTADNNFTDGSISVSIPGDIKGDFKVSLSDLSLLAKAYNTQPGDVKWNANADVNNSGAVGLADLAILALHWGQHYP